MEQRLPPVHPKFDGKTTPWSLIALLTTISATGALALNLLVPALPRLAEVLASDHETVQLTISLYLAGLAVSQLVVGPLSDRFGRRPVLICGFLLSGCAALACIAISNVYGLIAMRIVQAFGGATGLSTGRAIIRDVFDREHSAKMISIVASAMSVAPMVAPLIGGLIETFFGWQGIFLFMSLMSLGLVAWIWLTLPETRSREADVVAHTKFFPTVAMLLKDPRFIGYSFSAAIGSGSFFIFLGAGPHVIISMMGRSSTEFGLWFMPTAAGYLIGNMVTTRLAVRVGVDRMLLLGNVLNLIGGIVGVILLISIKSIGPLEIAISTTIMAIANGILLPNGIAGAISIRPQVAGTASGFQGFAQMGCGALFAQLAAHLVANASTPAPMIYAMVGSSLVALAVYPLVLRRGKKTGQRTNVR